MGVCDDGTGVIGEAATRTWTHSALIWNTSGSTTSATATKSHSLRILYLQRGGVEEHRQMATVRVCAYRRREPGLPVRNHWPQRTLNSPRRVPPRPRRHLLHHDDGDVGEHLQRQRHHQHFLLAAV